MSLRARLGALLWALVGGSPLTRFTGCEAHFAERLGLGDAEEPGRKR